jgi:hypothetical protein
VYARAPLWADALVHAPLAWLGSEMSPPKLLAALVAGAAFIPGSAAPAIRASTTRFDYAFQAGDAVEIVSAGPGSVRCLGIVAHERVVTAAHCAHDEVRLSPQGAAPITARAVIIDDGNDLAVLAISSAASHPNLPVIVRWNGDECGVGLLRKDRGAATETWEMVPTFVTESTDEYIETFSTRRGGCAGDSGGPLLGCDGRHCTLMGVLRHGSARCTGRDNYASWPRIARLLQNAADDNQR